MSTPQLYTVGSSTKPLRPATPEEAKASDRAAARDGGVGIIDADGRRCYVSYAPVSFDPYTRDVPSTKRRR